ncbi:MAG: hypothetical protein QM632_06730 [Micrococcaceae bacterium]
MEVAMYIHEIFNESAKLAQAPEYFIKIVESERTPVEGHHPDFQVITQVRSGQTRFDGPGMHDDINDAQIASFKARLQQTDSRAIWEDTFETCLHAQHLDAYELLANQVGNEVAVRSLRWLCCNECVVEGLDTLQQAEEEEPGLFLKVQCPEFVLEKEKVEPCTCEPDETPAGYCSTIELAFRIKHCGLDWQTVINIMQNIMRDDSLPTVRDKFDALYVFWKNVMALNERFESAGKDSLDLQRMFHDMPTILHGLFLLPAILDMGHSQRVVDTVKAIPEKELRYRMNDIGIWQNDRIKEFPKSVSKFDKFPNNLAEYRSDSQSKLLRLRHGKEIFNVLDGYLIESGIDVESSFNSADHNILLGFIVAGLDQKIPFPQIIRCFCNNPVQEDFLNDKFQDSYERLSYSLHVLNKLLQAENTVGQARVDMLNEISKDGKQFIYALLSSRYSEEQYRIANAVLPVEDSTLTLEKYRILLQHAKEFGGIEIPVSLLYAMAEVKGQNRSGR